MVHWSRPLNQAGRWQIQDASHVHKGELVEDELGAGLEKGIKGLQSSKVHAHRYF